MSDIVNYWIQGADKDYESMLKIYEAKQYTWTLFIGHLVIEKLLKGLYAQNNPTNPHPPKIHNLLILAKKCNLDIDNETARNLITFNSFNITARYEDYKNSFYEKCTFEYTKQQLEKIKEVRICIKNQLTK